MKILLTSFRLGTFLATLAGIPLYLSVRVAVSLAPHDDSEPFYSFQLPYGIDTEYLFPNTTINTLHHRDYEEDRIQVIQRALTEANVGSMFFLHKEKAKLPNPFYREGDWKIVREAYGLRTRITHLQVTTVARDSTTHCTSHEVNLCKDAS